MMISSGQLKIARRSAGLTRKPVRLPADQKDFQRADMDQRNELPNMEIWVEGSVSGDLMEGSCLMPVETAEVTPQDITQIRGT